MNPHSAQASQSPASERARCSTKAHMRTRPRVALAYVRARTRMRRTGTRRPAEPLATKLPGRPLRSFFQIFPFILFLWSTVSYFGSDTLCPRVSARPIVPWPHSLFYGTPTPRLFRRISPRSIEPLYRILCVFRLSFPYLDTAPVLCLSVFSILAAVIRSATALNTSESLPDRSFISVRWCSMGFAILRTTLTATLVRAYLVFGTEGTTMYRPHVFKVSYERDCHHRKPTCGGMDSEYSHSTRETTEELIIAPNLETAQFLWNHRSQAVTGMTNISWQELGQVSLMISDMVGV